MNEQMVAYFFGVRPGTKNGHYAHVPGLRSVYRDAQQTPWGSPVDELTALRAAWPEGYRDEGHYFTLPQTEGVPGFDHKPGWTLMALWDRSGDTRGGCCALFVLGKELTDEEAMALSRKLFPKVFARIEAHLGLKVKLAAVCCPTCRQALE